MKILIRKDNRSDWELVEAAEYSIETEIDENAERDPEETVDPDKNADPDKKTDSIHY